MLPTFRLLSHKFLLRNLIRFKAFPFSTKKNQMTPPENPMESLNELKKNFEVNISQQVTEANTHLFDENMKKLYELSKIFFPNIETFPLKSQLEIIDQYSAYRLLPKEIFQKVEKKFLTKMSKIEPGEFVAFVRCLGRNPNHSASNDTLVLMLEQRIQKNLTVFTRFELMKLLRYFNKMQRGSARFVRSIHVNFVNKMADYTLAESLTMFKYLLESRKCSEAFIKETFNVLQQQKISRQSIAKMSLEELVLFLTIFFSDFQIIVQDKTYFREKAKENLNKIITSGPFSDTGVSNATPVEFIKQQELFVTLEKEILGRMDEISRTNPETFDIQKVIQIITTLHWLKRVPKKEDTLQFILDFLKSHFLALTPREVAALIELALTPDGILNQKQINTFVESFGRYVDSHLQSFSFTELLEIWILIDRFAPKLNTGIAPILQNRIADMSKIVKWTDITKLFHLAVKFSKNPLVPSDIREQTLVFIQSVILPAMKTLFKFAHIRGVEFLAISNLILGFKSELYSDFLKEFFFLSSKSLLLGSVEEFSKVAGLLLGISSVYPQLDEISRDCLQTLESRYTYSTVPKPN